MSGTSAEEAGGAGGGAGGGGGEGGGGTPAPFYEGFKSEPLRTSPSIQKFGDVETLADAYVNLEKRYGIDPARRIDLPVDPKDEEGMRGVWTKLGLPEKPDGYGLKLDDKASDADKAMLASWTQAAHKMGMPADFALGAMKFWEGQVLEANKGAEEAQRVAREAGIADLKKEWGPAYDQKAREVGNALVKYGDADLQKALDGDALGNHPGLVKMLGKMLDRMAEPGGQPVGEPAGVERALTPSQSKAEANRIEAHPGFRDATHAQHKQLVADRLKFLNMAEAKEA